MGLDPEFAVSLFWDPENTRLLPHEVPFLVANVEASLRTVDKRYYLAEKKIVAGNDGLDFITENEKYLSDNGFTIVYAPHRERVCNYPNCTLTVQRSTNKRLPFERPFDVADNMILDEILDQVLTKQLCRNVLIISGDSDFSTTLQMLEINGRNTLIAVNENANRAYINKAGYAWIWDDMATRAAKYVATRAEEENIH